MADVLEHLRSALGDRYASSASSARAAWPRCTSRDDLRHDRKVAIKVLRPELAASLGADRFLREIQVAAKLQHPNILPLYDSGEADGLLYYVMPFVEGESLRDRLNREQQLPLDDALRITSEVAEALALRPRSTASCTGTSSRRTSCSRTATRWWRTSASRGR